MTIELNSKIVKNISVFNLVVKSSFTHYYLRFNGEAASTLKYHKAEDRLSYSNTQLPIHEFFTHIGLGPDEVLFIDANAMGKALAKKTKILHGFILDGLFNIVTSDTDILKGNPEWKEFNGTVTVPVARVMRADDCKKVFKVSRIPDDLIDGFTDITGYIEPLLKKKVILIKNNGFTIKVAKPLFQGLTTKTTALRANFQYHEQGLFKAHFCIEKEQICNYHTYIAFAILD